MKHLRPSSALNAEISLSSQALPNDGFREATAEAARPSLVRNERRRKPRRHVGRIASPDEDEQGNCAFFSWM